MLEVKCSEHVGEPRWIKCDVNLLCVGRDGEYAVWTNHTHSDAFTSSQREYVRTLILSNANLIRPPPTFGQSTSCRPVREQASFSRIAIEKILYLDDENMTGFIKPSRFCHAKTAKHWCRAACLRKRYRRSQPDVNGGFQLDELVLHR